MNLFNIIDEIENVDPTIGDRISPRRKAMKDFFSFGSKIAVSALPLALGSVFTKAYGQDKVPDDVIEVMNFALALEHLEYTFYSMALLKPGLLKAKDNIKAIQGHERQHVKFLTDTIKASGGTPVGPGKYDFTAKGAFHDVFTSYRTFLLVAQGFEDTGVRAYKGQAGNIKKSDAILKAALQIHSVEARHAAHIRFARRLNGFDPIVKPWIVGEDNTKGTPLEAIYKGEDQKTQVIFNLNNINGFDVGDAVTTSFDEPLDKANVLKIVAPFMADY